MKNTTLKTLFLLTISLFITSVYAQTDRDSYIPAEVGKVLEKIKTVDNMAMKEPVDLFTKEEKQLLKKYYQTSEMSNSGFRATGDVYALDVRNGGDYGSFPFNWPI